MTTQSAELSQLVEEQIGLKAQIDTLEDDLRSLKQRYDDVRMRRLPDLMNALELVGPDGKASFTHASGSRIYLTHKVRASVLAENQPDFFKWLREHGHGGIIKETIHAQTLGSFAKELLENGRPLPPNLTAHMETVAVVTQPKKGPDL